MLNWLGANWGNLLISAILIAIVAGVITKAIRNKRAGVSSCGCGCGCPGCTKGSCKK